MRVSLFSAIAIGALNLVLIGCAAVPDDYMADAAPIRKPAGVGIDAPIRDLMNSPATLAVLQKDMPGMVDDPRLDMVGSMSLRQIASFPQSGLDKAKLKSIQADLKATNLGTLTGGASVKPTAIAVLKN